jgi:hypothetical protein
VLAYLINFLLIIIIMVFGHCWLTNLI